MSNEKKQEDNNKQPQDNNSAPKKEGQKRQNEQKNSQHHKVKKRILLPSIIFTVLALGGIYALLHAHYYQSTDDAFVEGHIVSVAPRVSGPVVKLLIKDNQEVKKGDLLAEIDPNDYIVALEQKEAKLLEAKAQLTASHQNIEENQTISSKTVKDISSIKSQLDNAKSIYDRDLKLSKEGIVSKEELNNSKTTYDSLHANYLAEQEKKRAADIAVKQAIANRAEIEALIKRLESEIDEAKLNLSYTKIYAPQDGKISARTVEEGNYVQVAQPLMSIVSDEVWVVANYKETQLEQVREGQEVTIKVDTYPKKRFKGKVDSLQKATGAKSSLFPPENAVGSYVKIVQRIPVKIIFDEDISDYNIAPGMSVVPKIKIR